MEATTSYVMGPASRSKSVVQEARAAAITLARQTAKSFPCKKRLHTGKAALFWCKEEEEEAKAECAHTYPRHLIKARFLASCLQTNVFSKVFMK